MHLRSKRVCFGVGGVTCVFQFLGRDGTSVCSSCMLKRLCTEETCAHKRPELGVPAGLEPRAGRLFRNKG